MLTSLVLSVLVVLSSVVGVALLFVLSEGRVGKAWADNASDILSIGAMVLAVTGMLALAAPFALPNGDVKEGTRATVESRFAGKDIAWAVGLPSGTTLTLRAMSKPPKNDAFVATGRPVNYEYNVEGEDFSVFMACDTGLPLSFTTEELLSSRADARLARALVDVPEGARCRVDQALVTDVELGGVANEAIKKVATEAVKKESLARKVEAPDVATFSDEHTLWVVDGVTVRCSGTFPTVKDMERHLDKELPEMWSSKHLDRAIETFDVADYLNASCKPREADATFHVGVR